MGFWDQESYSALLEVLKQARGGNPEQTQGRPAKAVTTSPGRVLRLKSGTTTPFPMPGTDTIEAQSDDPLTNDWCIYIAPAPSALALLAAGSEWGVSYKIENYHDSALFFSYRPCLNYNRYPVPIVGAAIPIHGQRIRVGLFRLTDVTEEDVELTVAIIPRLPGIGVVVEPSSAEDGTILNVALPVMTRGIRIFTALSPGDSLTYVGANGVSILGTVNLVDSDLLLAIPVHPNAAFIRYNTTVPPPGKTVMVQFEVWT